MINENHNVLEFGVKLYNIKGITYIIVIYEYVVNRDFPNIRRSM